MGCQIKTSCRVKSVSSFDGGTYTYVDCPYEDKQCYHITIDQVTETIPLHWQLATESWRMMVQRKHTTVSSLESMHLMLSKYLELKPHITN
jgi:hypothetical protein